MDRLFSKRIKPHLTQKEKALNVVQELLENLYKNMGCPYL